MSDGSKARGRARLPVWRIVAEAYGTTFGNLLTLIRMAWLWVIMLLILVCGVFWSIHPMEEGVRDSASLGFSFTVPVLVASAIAVSWHRFVLLGERTNLISPISVDITVWRYFAWALASILAPSAVIAILFAGLPTYLPLMPMVEAMQETNLLVSLLFIVALIGVSLFVCWACVYVVMRFALILPAIGLRQSAVTLREAWVRTRGNGRKLVYGALLTGLPPLILSVALAEAFIESEGRDAYVAVNALYEFINLAGGMLGVSFLSIAYRHLYADQFAAPSGDGGEAHV